MQNLDSRSYSIPQPNTLFQRDLDIQYYSKLGVDIYQADRSTSTFQPELLYQLHFLLGTE